MLVEPPAASRAIGEFLRAGAGASGDRVQAKLRFVLECRIERQRPLSEE